MYSTPIFTVWQSLKLYDNPKFSSLRHLRNLHLERYFYRFPELDRSAKPQAVAAWNGICRSLASMNSLQNLCVSIRQAWFFINKRSDEENAKLVANLLEPLTAVKVVEGGRFDVVTTNWRLPGAPLPLGVLPFQIKSKSTTFF